MAADYGPNSAQVESYLSLVPLIYDQAQNSVMQASLKVSWAELSASAVVAAQQAGREESWKKAEGATQGFLAAKSLDMESDFETAISNMLEAAAYRAPLANALRFGALALVVRDLIPPSEFQALTAPLRKAGDDLNLVNLLALL